MLSSSVFNFLSRFLRSTVSNLEQLIISTSIRSRKQRIKNNNFDRYEKKCCCKAGGNDSSVSSEGGERCSPGLGLAQRLPRTRSRWRVRLSPEQRDQLLKIMFFTALPRWTLLANLYPVFPLLFIKVFSSFNLIFFLSFLYLSLFPPLI